jgi:hypothetical protein
LVTSAHDDAGLLRRRRHQLGDDASQLVRVAAGHGPAQRLRGRAVDHRDHRLPPV